MISSGWTLRRFLAGLASAEPSPGGGSAAALASALGCAVAGKVCRLILRRRRTPARARPGLRRAQAELARLSRRLELLIREDALAYAALVRAIRAGRDVGPAAARAAALPALPSPTRLAAGARARSRAIACPVAICECSVRALRCAARLEPLAGRHLGSDLRVSKVLLHAGFQGAYAMAKVNLEHSR